MRTYLVALLGMTCIACAGDDDGPAYDAAPQPDADPACLQANSYGGFTDCTVCTANGNGCDTIDVNGNQSKVCDCSAACPCGFHCGSIEIAPNVFTDNECIR
jgi:hypothetical protein